jgi:hypothetical protein
LKLLVRETRTRGTHVTPTVVINGVANPSIESRYPVPATTHNSYSVEQWHEILKKTAAS